jgi:NADP-dependent alcohol dehydrogenase
MIGHELTALAGVTHGASLAIVLPATMSVLREQKQGKILQYGERVWGITEGTVEERVEQAIARTREFFASLGLAVTLTEAGVPESVIDTIAERFTKIGAGYGEAGNVNGEIARQILLACLK